jgi:putative peptidoglycan lipid II flippase
VSDNPSISRQLFSYWRNFRPRESSLSHSRGQSAERATATAVLTVSLGALAAANILLSSLMYGYVLIAIGPGPQTDALFASVAVPRLVLAVMSGSLMHVLVPVLTVQAPEEVSKCGWSLFLLIGLCFGTVEILLHILAPFWVGAVVPGFSDSVRLLTVDLARIQLAAMVLSALCSVLGAFHQATKRFVRVELMSLLAAGVSFAVLFLALPSYGVQAAAWSVVIRTGLQVCLLLPGLGRYRQTDWHSPAIVEVWGRLKPLLFGTTYYKLGPLVDRFLSSMTPAGGLSLLYVGQQILTVVSDIFYKAFTVPTLPLLTRHAQAGEWHRFRTVLDGRLLWVGIVTGCGYFLFFWYGESLLAVVARFGRISGADVHSLWLIMITLVGFLIAGALGQLVSASFYAKGDTATPTLVGVIGFTIGVFLKVIGFLHFGLIGIAAGTTLYYILNLLVLLFLQKRELSHASA